MLTDLLLYESTEYYEENIHSWYKNDKSMLPFDKKELLPFGVTQFLCKILITFYNTLAVKFLCSVYKFKKRKLKRMCS